MKKTLSIFLTASLIISMIVGTNVSASAVSSGSAVGDLIIDGTNQPFVLREENAKFLKGFTAKWIDGTNINNISSSYNIGTCSNNNALSISVENDGVNDNAYGKSGTSIKSVITGGHDFDIVLGKDLKKGLTAANGHYSRLSLNSWDDITVKEGVSVAFWIKTEQSMSITTALSTSTGKNAIADEITVPKGTSVIEIPIDNFAIQDDGFIENGKFVINKYYIYYRPVNGYSETPVTTYFDNIGYYTNTPGRNAKTRNKAVAIYDFNGISAGTNTAGQPAVVEKGQSLTAEAYGNGVNTLSVEKTNAVLPYNIKTVWDFDSEKAIDSVALKAQTGYFSYSEYSLNTDVENTYDGSAQSVKFSWTASQHPRLMYNAEFTQKAGDGIAFWVKTENAVNLKFEFSEGWDGATINKTVALNAGENIVKIKYSDFTGYMGGKIIQPRIDLSEGVDNTIWIDSFVTYTESEIEYTNPNTYGGTGSSLHYYTNQANSGYNGVKLNFTKIPLTNNEISWQQDATVCIWFNSSRSVPCAFKAQDSEQWHDSASTWWSTDDYTIPAGESVIRIPVSDFKNVSTQGTKDSSWDFLGSLNVCFKWAADNSEYDLYIDHISVEYPVIGDANDDESINIMDLISIKKKLASDNQPSLIKAIDVNGDGKFNSGDLAKFRKYLLGVENLASTPLLAGYTYLEPTEAKTGYTQIASLLSNTEATNVQGATASVEDVKTTVFRKALKITLGDADAYFANPTNIKYYVSWNTEAGSGSPINIGDAIEDGYLELWIKTPYATTLKLLAVGKGYYPVAELTITTTDSTEWQKVTLPVAKFKDGGESMSYDGMVELRISADTQDMFIGSGDSIEIGSLNFFCPTNAIGSSGVNKTYPIAQNELTTYTGENYIITNSIDSPWSANLVSSYGGVAITDPNYSKFKNITTVKLNTATTMFDVAIAKSSDEYNRVQPINLDNYILTGTIRTYIKVDSATKLLISLKNGYANSNKSVSLTKDIDPADAVDGYVELQIPIKEFYDKAVSDNISFRFDKFSSFGITAVGDFTETDELVYSNFEVWAKEASAPSEIDNTTKYTCANGSGITLVDTNNIMPAETVVKAFRNTVESADLTTALTGWSTSASFVDAYYVGTVSDSDLATPVIPNGTIYFSIPKSYLFKDGNITEENINSINAAFYADGSFKNATVTVSGDKLLIETDVVGDLVFFTGNSASDVAFPDNTLSISLVEDHPGLPGYDAVYEVKVYDNDNELSVDNYTLSCGTREILISGNTFTVPASFKDNTTLEGTKIYVTANQKTAFYPIMIKNWTLSLEDNFDGTELDNSVWTNSSNATNAVSVSNGKLSMRIVQNDDESYSDPKITTSRKFSQKYGCFVARMQMPQTTSGVVSAFWLLPSNYNKQWGTSYLFNKVNGEACGEVDMIEYSSAWDGEAQSAIQCWNPVTMVKTGAYEVKHTNSNLTPNNGYVDVAAVWTENAVYIYYDGQLQRSVKNISATGEKAAALLSMHSNWGGFTGEDLDNLETLVDYVKVYQ